jgi:hypothetical protein
MAGRRHTTGPVHGPDARWKASRFSANLRSEVVGTRSTASLNFSLNGNAVERVPTGFLGARLEREFDYSTGFHCRHAAE